MYKESGFEVHLEPLPEKTECESCVGDDEKDECRICFEGFEDQYTIIFTRPGKDKIESENDLF
jgi:recombinational DNA repair protein RecR